jgi:protein-S-isoprenylcysteine O-methyltransferase Ste14
MLTIPPADAGTMDRESALKIIKNQGAENFAGAVALVTLIAFIGTIIYGAMTGWSSSPGLSIGVLITSATIAGVCAAWLQAFSNKSGQYADARALLLQDAAATPPSDSSS